MSGDDAAALVEKARKVKGAEVVACPRVTPQNGQRTFAGKFAEKDVPLADLEKPGQTRTMHFQEGAILGLTPMATTDRKYVLLENPDPSVSRVVAAAAQPVFAVAQGSPTFEPALPAVQPVAGTDLPFIDYVAWLDDERAHYVRPLPEGSQFEMTTLSVPDGAVCVLRYPVQEFKAVGVKQAEAGAGGEKTWQVRSMPLDKPVQQYIYVLVQPHIVADQARP